MTTKIEPATDPALRIAELETENRLLQSRVQTGRINEIKLLEMQRIASAATWELNIPTGQLSGTVALAGLLGIDSLDGAPFSELLALLHPEDRDDFVRDYEQSRQSGKSFEREHRFLHADGSERIVRHFCRTLLSREGNPVLSLGVLQDSTQMLAEARHREEMFNQEKLNFASNISHEIRTPMNSIIGMSHLVLKGDLPVESRQYIEKINRSAVGLIAIINDILDFTKLGEGRMELMKADFRLEDVFNHVADMVSIRAEEKHLSIRLELGSAIPSALIGDPLRLGQVFGHLVGNAIKFTDVGEVVIRVEEVVRVADETELHFAIRDSGIGMNPEQQTRIFESFTQIEAANTRRHGGTGIGLALCKNLVEHMGGRIWVESAPGAGSTFHFHARFALQPQQPAWRITRFEQPDAGLLDFVVPVLRHTEPPVDALELHPDVTHKPPPAQAEALLDKLQTLLAQSDVTAIDVANELALLAIGTTLAGPLADLRKILDQYDYDAAQSALIKLRAALSKAPIQGNS